MNNFTINLQSKNSILTEFTTLRDQIGEWADKNFDVHLPELGVAEEVGELTHAVLKREQRIRGEAANKTHDEIVDALSDAAIYMLHLAYKKQLTPNFANELVPLNTEFGILGAMHRAVGTMILNMHVYHHDSIFKVEWAFLFTQLWNFATLHDEQLLNITKSVWAKVSKRNWRKFKHDGLTK